MAGKKTIPAPLSPDSTPVEPVRTPRPKKTDVGGSTFRPNFSKVRDVDHHVAKLMPATNIKNKSFKPGGYIPFPQEHSHIWHSISSNSAQPKKYAVPMLGHTHEITMKETEDGFVLECGPAVVEANIKTSSDNRAKAFQRKLLRKGLRDENGEPIDGEGPIYDDHKHEVVYIKSEKLQINI